VAVVIGLSTVNTIAQSLLIVVNAGLGVLALGTLPIPDALGRETADRLRALQKIRRQEETPSRFVHPLLSSMFQTIAPINCSHLRGARDAPSCTKQSNPGNGDYRRAISLDPDNASAHYSLGTVHENFHNYDDAIVEYRSAIALDSRFLEAQNNVARLYLWRGRIMISRTHFKF